MNHLHELHWNFQGVEYPGCLKNIGIMLSLVIIIFQLWLIPFETTCIVEWYKDFYCLGVLWF